MPRYHTGRLPRTFRDATAVVIVLGCRPIVLTARRATSHRWPRWLADAETIRTAIMARLYSAEDAAFYDVDAQDRSVLACSMILGCGIRYFPTLNGTVAVVVSHAIASFPLFCVTSLKKIVN